MVNEQYTMVLHAGYMVAKFGHQFVLLLLQNDDGYGVENDEEHEQRNHEDV